MPSSGASRLRRPPWLSYQNLEPVAVPPADVARRLWSVHQVAVALGLRLSRIERAGKRQDRAS
jgi:hypothetical protein